MATLPTPRGRPAYLRGGERWAWPLWPRSGPLDFPARPPRRPRRGWFFFGALLLAGLVVVAHGCHAGDHDDEPAWFYLVGRKSPSRPPRQAPAPGNPLTGADSGARG